MIIRDELYGSIECSELEEKIIDSTEFQRLHRIKQMAFTYLVYPGAMHTRFEHSLGTMHLAGTIAQKLGCNKEMIEKIRLFGLVHDIGHVAFSHESEVVLKKYLGNHEEIGRKKLATTELKDIIEDQFSVREILALEDTIYGNIITSEVGADRMDYLVRDARNTGVAYGIIEVDRIIHTLAIENDELIITYGGLNAVENLLIARYMMFSTVYLHHTVRIAAAMWRKAIETAIEGGFDPEKFLTTGDEEILIILEKTKALPHITGLQNRRLYKEVMRIEPTEKLKKNREKLEEELETIMGMPILIDYPASFVKPVAFRVKTKAGIIPINELSDLIKTLESSEQKRKQVLILAKQIPQTEKIIKLLNECSG